MYIGLLRTYRHFDIKPPTPLLATPSPFVFRGRQLFDAPNAWDHNTRPRAIASCHRSIRLDPRRRDPRESGTDDGLTVGSSRVPEYCFSREGETTGHRRETAGHRPRPLASLLFSRRGFLLLVFPALYPGSMEPNWGLTAGLGSCNLCRRR